MRRFLVVLFLGGTASCLGADSQFWDRATALLADGNAQEALVLAQNLLVSAPDDADALVIAGTATLYQAVKPRRDDSIFRPAADPAEDPTYQLDLAGLTAVAAFWQRVPDIDVNRSYLWGDLAQLAFRSGATIKAQEYAQKVLDTSQSDPETLRAAASVFALRLDWTRAAQTASRIPGDRTALLYQGLEAWRTGKGEWRPQLKAFVDGPPTSGSKLAAYLLGPAMRDTADGYLEALKSETGVAALAVRQKHVDRYTNQFLPRLELARSLAQLGSFDRALEVYAELNRRKLASTSEEKQAVLFQQAWAYQGSGKIDQASPLWSELALAQDFYLRSAALWFLGEAALRQGRTVDARDCWTKIAGEPSRSKYAAWAAIELRNLR